MIYSDITPELIFDFRYQRLLHWDPRLLEEDSDCGDYDDDGDWDSTNDTDEDRNDDDDRDDDAADDNLLTLKKTIVSTSSTVYIIDAIQSIKLLRKILYVEHNKYNLLKQFS